MEVLAVVTLAAAAAAAWSAARRRRAPIHPRDLAELDRRFRDIEASFDASPVDEGALRGAADARRLLHRLHRHRVAVHAVVPTPDERGTADRGGVHLLFDDGTLLEAVGDLTAARAVANHLWDGHVSVAGVGPADGDTVSALLFTHPNGAAVIEVDRVTVHYQGEAAAPGR